jgi:hypothetical protein
MKIIFKLTCVTLYGTSFTGPIAFNRKLGQLERFPSKKVAEYYRRVNSDWEFINIKRL